MSGSISNWLSATSGDKCVTVFYGYWMRQLEEREWSVEQCIKNFGEPLWIITSNCYDECIYNVLVFSTVGSWQRDYIEGDFLWPDDLDAIDSHLKHYGFKESICDICIIFRYKQCGGDYSTCQPSGPLLHLFADILTYEQIIKHGGTSNEPTYDADDLSSDDD